MTLIQQGDQVVIINSAVYAMKMLQKSMEGEAEKVGLKSDEDIDNTISEMQFASNTPICTYISLIYVSNIFSI